jgi:hypothetical protein
MTIARMKILLYRCAVSSAELLHLLSREHLAQAASEIELFHVEDEPRIMALNGVSEEKTPENRALGLVRSHRCGVVL